MLFRTYFIACVAVACSYIAPALAATALTSRGDGCSVAPTCARGYTVRSGDTCNSISAHNSVSTYQLAHVNSNINTNCDNLQVGETLCLGIVGQDCTVVRVVNSGDICISIAAAANIPESTLLANNPNINAGCTNIYPGEVLCTSSQIFNY